MKLQRRLSVPAFLVVATTAFAQNADDAFVKSVFARLLAAPVASRSEQQYASWPPEVSVISAEREGARAAEQMRLNAFAAAPDCHPIVRISHGLLDEIVQGDPDLLALILGHELGHVLLGHPQCTPARDSTSLLQMAVTREQEYAADAKGYELALAAGYSVHNGLKGLQHMDAISHYSSFEALGADHPSWTDRLARLDAQQAPLWHTMSAFSDGVSFLATENYELAATCFRSVVREFPQAADVMGNLGYTLLMQYVDELRDEDVRALGIGQLATGSFYGESLHLKSKLRGLDTSLWTEAVQMLKAAEQADPGLALVKANLGLAYLVQPSGSKPKQALAYLLPAANMLRDDKAMQNGYGNMAARAVLNNTAVAYLALGDRRSAGEVLQVLWNKQQRITDEQAYLQSTALYYNVGSMLATSEDASERVQAADVLDKYLHSVSAQSMWWRLAYDAYRKVCPQVASGCATEAQLQAASHVQLREVVGVNLGSGKSLRLGESFENAVKRIGQGQQVGNVPGTTTRRLRYPRYGLDLVVSDVIVAIILKGTTAPELHLRQVGAATEQSSIRYGMTSDDLEKALVGQPYRYEGLLDTWIPYRFYPGIGIAAHIGPQKTVDELVLVRSAANPGE